MDRFEGAKDEPIVTVTKAKYPSGEMVPIEIERHLARMAGEYERMYQEILGPELTRYRSEQDAKHGGPEHDDTHTPGDWIRFIREYVEAASDNILCQDRPEMFEENLIHVAALAVAAVQSIRRINKVVL